VAAGSEPVIEAVLQRLGAQFDLVEPFERIRQAIGEAHATRAA
jgi:hypothetical protein